MAAGEGGGGARGLAGREVAGAGDRRLGEGGEVEQGKAPGDDGAAEVFQFVFHLGAEGDGAVGNQQQSEHPQLGWGVLAAVDPDKHRGDDAEYQSETGGPLDGELDLGALARVGFAWWPEVATLEYGAPGNAGE